MKIDTTVFRAFPIIKTERLTLRDIRSTDAREIFEMRSNGRVNQFIARETMQSVQDASSLIGRTSNAFQSQQGIGWAGILRDTNKIIGTCGFNSIDHPNLHAEIGGEMSVDYWGKNIALEAVSAIVDFGFNTMHLHSFEAKVAPGNRGAIYILEALGFKKEGHFTDRIFFNGNYYDMAIYTNIKK